MQLFQQSEATAAQRRFPVYLVDQTDGLTPETGETGGQPQISKNGGAFANTTNTLTAVGNGAYYVELTATELDTVGFINIRYDSAATAEFNIPAQVVPWDPYDVVRAGLTALPNAAAEAAGGLFTRGTGAGQINQQTNGQIDANVERWLNSVVNALVTGRVDASVGAMAASVLTAAAIATDAITADKIAAAAITSSEAPNLDAAISTRATPAQVATELVNIGLDHLLSAAVVGTDIADNSILARIVSASATADWDDFVNTTDSLQALRDFVATLATAAALSTVQSDTDDIQTRLPAALVSGRMDSSVGAMAADVLTAAALATDAVNEIRDAILPEQNTALSNIPFLFVAASDHVTPVTGATGISVTRSIDGGAFGAGTGTVAEVANGIYQYDASAADMNGGIITFRFVATGGTPGAPDDRFVTVVTGAGV